MPTENNDHVEELVKDDGNYYVTLLPKEYIDIKVKEVIDDNRELKGEVHKLRDTVNRIEGRLPDLVSWRGLALAVSSAAGLISLAFLLRGR